MATTQFPPQPAAPPAGAALPPNDRIGQNGLTPMAPTAASPSKTSPSHADAGDSQSSLIPVGQASGGNAADLNDSGDALHLPASCARMPVGLVVSVPIRDFRVRNLLAMTSGVAIETQWAPGEDLPLSSGDVQLAWTEFEVVDTRLAVRVTRLA